MKPHIYIGIDPGVHTGLAVWDKSQKKLISVGAESILEAMRFVLEVCQLQGFDKVLVKIENPNERQWFGNSGREKLQGAGSIKRDYSIWMEFFTERGINYQSVSPKNNRTKLNADTFQKYTGWTERTNNHGRDAAMLVYGH